MEMQDIIELYLAKTRKCPLPDIGTLCITESNAVAWYADKKIEAPVPTIVLQELALPVDDFIEFIAVQKGISNAEASELLHQYCVELKNLEASGENILPHSGKFYVDTAGKLVFKPVNIPKAYTPSVPADRVLHPVASHNVMVGDKETTTAEMAAYYSDAANARKDRWWIWAAALLAAGIGGLAYYLSDPAHSNSFGNAQKSAAPAAPKTYKLAQ